MMYIMDAEQYSFRKMASNYQKAGIFPKGNDGLADAWRHVATSKYFTERYGASITKILGVINEGEAVIHYFETDDEKQKAFIVEQTKMDFKNNKIGRNLAGKKVNLIQDANKGQYNT